MRILVYGAGVIGSTLAANLSKAKKDVTVLARGKWAQQIRDNGLVIDRQYSPFTLKAKVNVIEKLAEDDVYDVIFVVMRYTQLDSVIDVLKNNPSKNIIFVGNNLRPKAFSQRLTGRYVMFGFYLAGGHREEDRVCSIDMKKMSIGNLKESVSNETLVKEIFGDTDIKTAYYTNMEDYLLTHAAFVIPPSFACYHTNGDLKQLVFNKHYLNRIVEANLEAYRAIEKAGHSILPSSERSYESFQYRRACYRMYQLMAGTKLGKVCAVDHALNASEEMAALNNDMKAFFEENNAEYDNWKMLEAETNGWLLPPYKKEI